MFLVYFLYCVSPSTLEGRWWPYVRGVFGVGMRFVYARARFQGGWKEVVGEVPPLTIIKLGATCINNCAQTHF